MESLKAAPTVTNLTAFDVLPGSAPVCLAVHFLLTPLALARYTMGFERLVKPRVAYSPLVVAPALVAGLGGATASGLAARQGALAFTARLHEVSHNVIASAVCGDPRLSGFAFDGLPSGRWLAVANVKPFRECDNPRGFREDLELLLDTRRPLGLLLCGEELSFAPGVATIQARLRTGGPTCGAGG